MMWSYNTNVMGPYGLWWYEENNIPWDIIIVNNRFTKFKDVERKKYKEVYYGGRIDTYCDNTDDPDWDYYMPELSLPIMSSENFARFDNWLDNFKSEKLLSFEDLKILFEKDNGELVLFKEHRK